MKRLLLICLVVFTTLASGCSLLPSRAQPWAQAQQEKPLQVPPGVHAPSSAAAMHVAGISASESQMSVNENDLPPGVSNDTTVTVASISGTPSASKSLLFSDTPDSVYRRVGIALQRGDVGTITASDASAHRYKIEVKIKGKAAPEKRGFFGRIFSVFSHRQVSWVKTTVKIQVLADGKQSKVVIKGPGQAVSKVRTLLAVRLAGN